jgi:hypothetical protein
VFTQVNPNPLVSEIILLTLIFLGLIPPRHLDSLNLILYPLHKFFFSVEVFLVLFVQKEDIVARISLELLVDQHSVDEKSCISELFAVASVHHVQNGVETG